MKTAHVYVWISAVVGVGLTAGIAVSAAQTHGLLNYDAVWKYNDAGTNQGAAWKDMSFDDSDWRSGPGVLVARRPPNLMEPLPELAMQQGAQNQTLVRLTNSAGETMRTHYFRTHFHLPVPPAGVLLTLSNIVDAGAVWHLNGQEIARWNLPPPPAAITFDTPATNEVEVAQTGVVVLNAAGNLVEGDNVLAVEVHQSSGNSSDMVFGMTLSYTTDQAPTITTQPTNSIVEAGHPWMLAVVATGYQCQYRWQRRTEDGTFADLPGASAATYSDVRASVDDAGDYRAIVSNLLGSLTSVVARVQVVPDETGPVILSAIAQPRIPPYQVVLTFSEPVDILSARVSTNYVIRQVDSTNQLAASVSGFPQGPKIILDVSEWSTNLNYIVTVNHVKDRAGNVIAPDSQAPLWFAANGTLVSLEQEWRYYTGFTPPPPGWQTNQGLVVNSFLPTTGDFSRTGYPVFFSDRFGIPHSLCPGMSLRTIVSSSVFTYPWTTNYFKTRFDYPDPPNETTLIVQHLVADGVVFYLNGTEIGRYELPRDVIISVPEEIAPVFPQCFTSAFVVTNLVPGSNILAAEVATEMNDDLLFGAEVWDPSLAASWSLSVEPPVLRYVRQDNQLVLSWTGGGWALEWAEDLFGTWHEAQPDMANPYVTSLSNHTHQFWRLHRQLQ